MGFRLDKIVVFGVGLIGGSFALALKKAGVVGQVVGIGRSQATLDEALRLGLIDCIGACDAATVGNADLLLLATPVGQMPALMRAMLTMKEIGSVLGVNESRVSQIHTKAVARLRGCMLDRAA